MEEARCNATEHPDAFYKETDRKHVYYVKRFCDGCPVVKECREFSILNQEEFGIWGGLTSIERWAVIRANRKRRLL